MLKQRIITALLLAPLVIAAIFYLPPLYFSLFIAVVITLGAWEWGPFMGFTSKVQRIAFCVLLFGVMAITQFMVPAENIWVGDNQLAMPYQVGVVTAAVWWALSLAFILIYPRGQRVWRKNIAVKGAFGLLTLLPAWLAINALRHMNYEQDAFFGAWMICIVLGIVWATDIGAYFSGKSFGKHKLMPNVSPNKTMEGLLGGVLFAVLFVLAISYYHDVSHSLWLEYAFFTAIIALASAVGDLSESMLKRDAGIKDSGKLLPGHGGVLDRIDSLTAAAPVFIVIYSFWG
ncbi:phosphatidate cytidylyltransferase [Flocculibacter collagenilyticus]|uniref:phosphatidate cytidylyltransferase n=1 Tax=Flocculibacter collagenilyticus TaxID=2744479 RepID=UPI0018F6C12E|nr:phosphatidate cytidylyltransferase [Flocculibacter collagenilyticus]